MNEFLDNLGKVVNETAKKAFKVSGDVVELTKTSLNIKFDEVKRESFFKEIGKIIYNSYKESPESVTDEILDFCKCLDEIENSINAQKARAAGIKNKKYCVNCGKILDKAVNYCYSCGAKQPEIIEEAEEEICDCGCGMPVDECDCGDGCCDEPAEDEECCCCCGDEAPAEEEEICDCGCEQPVDECECGDGCCEE